MVKLLKYFTFKQWLLTVLLLVLVVAQCYCDVTLPTYTAELIAKMQQGAGTASILKTGGDMLLYAAGSIACIIGGTFLAAYIITNHSKKLRSLLFKKVETFSLAEINKFSTPSLITRTTNDIQQVSTATMLFLRIGFGAPLTAILALIKINTSNQQFTLSVGIGISLMLAGIMLILVLVSPKFKLIQKLTDRLNGITLENLSGLRVIKAYNAEEFQQKKFETINKDMSKVNIFTNRMTALISPLISIINFGLTIAIYWLGCYLIIKNNDPSLFPDMFAFTQLSAQIIMAFMMLFMVIVMLPRAQVSANRIREVLSTNCSIVDPATPEALDKISSIEFCGVDFCYPNCAKPAISNISFKICTGETLAIVGATGSGKTTIANLIPRLFDASGGEVLINSIGIKSYNQSDVHKKIGYVPQKNILFSGTIKDNIGYGDESISDPEITLCAQTACAEEFISGLENGYETKVSQGGKNFSGGQKQRLAIARALAINPDVLVFDDSFSALDFKTDASVRQNLNSAFNQTIKIIVAQRIGTVINADKIIVLKDGGIIGSGNHKELLDNCEEYRYIALSQMKKEELGL